MAIFSTVIAVASVVGSLIQGNKAKKASKKANRAQRAINRLKNAQQKRAFLRRFRQAQAAALVGATASGVEVESSLTQGTLASQKTQNIIAGAEFQEFDRLGGLQTQAFNEQANANFAGSIFSSVGAFASSSGGASFLNSLGPKKPTT